MRRYPRLMFFSLWLSFLLFSAGQCATQKVEDCYEDRKTMQEVNAVEGVISQQGKAFIIIVESMQKHYAPCNLASEWQVDQKSIRFSGMEKEVYPHERWAGLPFVITTIQTP